MSAIGSPPLTVVGHGVDEGFLSPDQIESIAARGMAQLPVDGQRVLVLIPDGTRTMPMPMLFGILERQLASRVTALDFLVALGTHVPMSDTQLSRLVGREVRDGLISSGALTKSRIFNHRWDDPSAFAHLGEIPAEEIEALTGGLLREAVPVKLNRLILDYDDILICGPVFPHEVASFQAGPSTFSPASAARS